MQNGNEINQLLPGQPLRVGVDLIADKNSGGLIVIGTSNKLEKISSGGINLIDCNYSPEMLSELSKMDGAIIVSNDVTKILKANVHLNPSDSLPTSQTGTRHRTAERTAEETDLTVITVSEESSLVKVFNNTGTTELEEPSVTLGRVNESLQSVDRMRRRFDDAVDRLSFHKSINREKHTPSMLKASKIRVTDARKQFSILRKILNLKYPVNQAGDEAV